MLQDKDLKVLIVDDSAENLQALDDILIKMNVTVLKAASGGEALRHLLNHEVFLIIMDVSMPKMNGFETAELMRRNEKLQNIPIIFITSLKREEKYVFKGYQLGAVDYLFKPVEPIILRSKVRVFMDIFEKEYLLREKTILLEKKIEELMHLRAFNYKLEKLSFYDSLTGINNRRRFEEALNTEWNRALRQQSELSIIMMDVDNFKSYNDNYGHLSGDKCLKKVADVLYKTVKRATDIVARYGGEEFTVLLPNTDNYGAMDVAEKIRKNIECLNIRHEFSTTDPILTVSLGVNTVIPTPSKYKQEFIENADRALYKAKDIKKNLVYNAEGM